MLGATFLAVRARYPWIFEYEAAETSVSSAAFVEHGTPPRAYHRIRYTAIFVGPLHAYLKAIPYFFTFDPAGEIISLNVLNVVAAGLLFFLLRQLFGLWPATLALFVLAFSAPSIARCTAAHVRCYSVPLVLIVMVLTARVLLLRERWLMPLLAVALAFATQVYGFATLFLPPGLCVLFLLFEPRVPLRTWLRCAVIFAALQLPWIAADVWGGVAGPVWLVSGDGFSYPAGDAQDIVQARAGALGFIGSISEVVLFNDRTMLYVGVAALAVMIAAALRTAIRRAPLRTNADLFFLLWLAMFLVLPAYIGAGPRVYLAQFLGPVIIGRGLTLPLVWLVRQWPRTRRAVQVVGVFAAIVLGWHAVEHLAGPRPTTILSDPIFPQSLEEIRSVVRHLHARGLGRVGFNRRVHGIPVQSDLHGDSYLFWTLCGHDTRVPCSADANGPPAQTHFAILEREFPFRPAEGAITHHGTLRVVEYESRLQLPFRAVAFRLPSTRDPGRDDERIAGPPGAVRATEPGVSPAEEADRLATIETWPADRPGVPAFPLRRASQVAALMVEHGLDEAFAAEANYPGPDPSPLEVVLRGTLEIDRLPEPGQELRLFLTASADGGRCDASIFLDGLRLPQSRFQQPGGDSGHPLLTLQADTTGFLRPGRHAVAIRLHDCSAERYDFYDLVVASPAAP